MTSRLVEQDETAQQNAFTLGTIQSKGHPRIVPTEFDPTGIWPVV